MANVLEFKGIFYNPSSFTNYEEVLAPPYDEISDEMLEQLYRRSPYNIARVEKPKEQKGKYETARKFLETARKNSILIKEEKPGIILYEQTFISFYGQIKKRTGFISLLSLEEFYKKNIFPHEQTFLKPKQDRLKLLENCNMHVSCIFAFYEDSKQSMRRMLRAVKQRPPFISFADASGLRHRLWNIQDGKLLSRIKNILKPKKVFIADGHHRYETALWFFKRNPKRLPHAIMCYFAEMNDPGLEVLPIHRLVKLKKFDKNAFLLQMKKYFQLKKFSSAPRLQRYLEKEARQPAFGTCFGKERIAFILKNKKIINSFVPEKHSADWKSLSVNVLHHLTLERILHFSESEKSPFISYVKNLHEALPLVEREENMVLFLLPTIPPETIKKLSLKKELMPRKSTFFYPKIPTGIVLSEID